MPIIAIAIAVGAAGCNALSSVMQRKANRERPAGEAFGWRSVMAVLRTPAWLAGFGLMLCSFLLQAAALRLGQLASVEPVLVLELPLTLFIAWRLLGARLHRRDWVAIGIMAVGLAAFVWALSPRGGRAADVSATLALVAAAGTAVAVTALAAVGRWGPGSARAALFGAAAGCAFGLTASLLKLAVSALSNGIWSVFATWPVYAMAVTGVSAVLLVQAALHAGTLVAAQPGITLGDPLVAVLWGVLMFHETVRGGWYFLAAGAGGVAIVVGVFSLAAASHAAASPS